ncbi:MAG: hypothetical protein O6945_15440 [Gammaproteobacteria bacterium]|nr:hypothetical protein [Gammaproteobacteria bacterium]
MKYRSFLLLAAVLSLSARAGIELVQPETRLILSQGLTETVWRTSVAPDRQFDWVGLHRFRRADNPPVAILFYLPGTNMNGQLAVTDENHNLWLYLASRGVTVYVMDYRTYFVPHDTDVSLEFMRDWTMALFVDDAELLATEVKKQNPDVPLFVSGFSRGVSFAYAVAGRMEFAGLIALDGSFKRFEPVEFDLAGALKQFRLGEDYASRLARRGYAWRNGLMTGAYQDPAAPALDEKYGTIGEQLSEVLHFAWGPGALANTRDNLTPIRILGKHMASFDWYYPKVQDIEGRSLASHRDDPSTDLDNHFGKMKLPILYFGSGNFGATNLLHGIYSAARSGSKDVTVNVLEGYGHQDVLVATSAKAEVYDVVLAWIKSRLDN